MGNISISTSSWVNEDLQSPNSLIPQENVKILMEEALEFMVTWVQSVKKISTGSDNSSINFQQW